MNFIDTYQRSGIYKVEYPFTPGSESAGTVEAVGDGVTDFAVGDRVATAEGSRSYAGYTLVDADKAFRCRTVSTTTRRQPYRCRE